MCTILTNSFNSSLTDTSVSLFSKQLFEETIGLESDREFDAGWSTMTEHMLEVFSCLVGGRENNPMNFSLLGKYNVNQSLKDSIDLLYYKGTPHQ